MIKNRETEFNIPEIIDRLRHIPEKRIVVIGDFSLDKYVYSSPERDELSVETGLTAYQIHATSSFPGIGGTVTNNLRSLGAQVACVGLVGDDGNGFELLRELKRIGADTSGMVVSAAIQTNTYMKPMRGTNRLDSVEINRLDFRNFAPTSTKLENDIIDNLRNAIQGADGVIITDQFLERNHSVVTDRVRNEISSLALKNRHLFFYADSRGFIHEFKNVIRKCNEAEAERSGLLAKCENYDNPVYITMGAAGIRVCHSGKNNLIPSFKATPPLDICGAGDATNSGIMIGLTLGLNYEEAALLGACVSSITIEQIGITGVATVEQTVERLRSFK